eukprot:TRINITY_DN4547_c0_g1_i2.p1 TRINITY_DN4547_c0_g1~~TRINITY_DN4547_c0_g1_i2.p1  ORF type:complete len:623 (+),score=77.39 TRINITY_DN4547_c0_g1_i2:64-1932(+)
MLPDAFYYIARKMFNAQTGVRLQSRKVMLRTINFTFTGSEGVDWIIRNLYIASDRTKATEIGNFIMQHAGGTFEQIGSTAKRIGILKDDNTLYKPLKIYQDQVVEVSQDEFAKQLQLSSDDEEGSANGPDPAGSESQVRRTNSGGEIWLSASTATPLEGSTQTPDHSASTTPRSGPNSRPSSRSASSKSLPRNSIHSGYVSQGESSVVTVEINIDDAEKGAKRRRAASVANIIRPISVGADNDRRKPYELMEDLILDPDMTLLMAIADIGLPKRDVEHFARAVVYIHCQRGTDMLPVLNLLLADEVNTNVAQMLLFRSNNFNTYALSAFAKQVGQAWLRTIFQPVLEALSTHDEIQFDEDGYILPSSERPFCALLEEVMDRICASVSECPPQLRLICKNIRELLPAKNKPEMFFHIASFLFLRVICPALLVPDEYGLLTSPLNHHRQRILVQLSKTIQSYCGQKAERPPKQAPAKRVRRNDATTDTDGESDDSLDKEVVEEEPASELPLLQGMAAANKAALAAFVQRLTAIGHLRKVKPFKLEHPSKEVHQRALQAIHTLLADKAQEILNRIQAKHPEMLPDVSYMIEQLGNENLPELKRAASAVTPKSRSRSNLNANVLRL